MTWWTRPSGRPTRPSPPPTPPPARPPPRARARAGGARRRSSSAASRTSARTQWAGSTCADSDLKPPDGRISGLRAHVRRQTRHELVPLAGTGQALGAVLHQAFGGPPLLEREGTPAAPSRPPPLSVDHRHGSPPRCPASPRAGPRQQAVGPSLNPRERVRRVHEPRRRAAHHHLRRAACRRLATPGRGHGRAPPGWKGRPPCLRTAPLRPPRLASDGSGLAHAPRSAAPAAWRLALASAARPGMRHR